MTYRDPHESLRTLYAVAVTQGGYFTAKQASAAGYDYSHLAYHLKAGNFDRSEHGLYRLVTIPTSEYDDLIRLCLWSRNRQDAPQAVVSHQSALMLHQLSDVLPRRIHLTVPPNFRKQPPEGCLLHKATISPRDIEQRDGHAVTTPLRTLVDVAKGTSVTEEQLNKAVEDALERGSVRLSQLQQAARSDKRASRLLQVPAINR